MSQREDNRRVRSRAGSARWLIALLLALGVGAAFGQALSYGFVNYDDQDYVTRNPHVLGGLNSGNLLWAATARYASNWHPLTWLSLQCDATLFGPGAFGFHLTNLLLHLAAVLLFFFWLVRTTGATGRSAVAAALFALHPLRVESVVWIAERKDVLAAFFWMLTLWAYTGYAVAPSRRRYLLVALCLALGLLAKPMLVTLPLVLLLLDRWPLRRAGGMVFAAAAAGPGAPAVPAAPEGARQASWRRLVAEKLPLLALSVLSSLMTVGAQRGTIATIDALPAAQRMGNALVAAVSYVGKMLWPAHLAAIYPFPQGGWPIWRIAGSGLALALLTLLCLRARGRGYPLTGWLWYLIALVPVSGLVQVGVAAMADRYTYLTQAGLGILLAWGLPDLGRSLRMRLRRQTSPAAREHPSPARGVPARQFPAQGIPAGRPPAWSSRVLAAVCLAAALLLVARSRAQTASWKDSLALWNHAIAVTPPNYVAQYNLASVYAHADHPQEADEHYRLALAVKPDSPDLIIDQGINLVRLGRMEEAEACYRRALQLAPGIPEGHNSLGAVLLRTGRYAEAAAECGEAVRLRPGFAEAHYNLALALSALGETGEAIAHCHEALRLSPGFTQAATALRELQARKAGSSP